VFKEMFGVDGALKPDASIVLFLFLCPLRMPPKKDLDARGDAGD